MDINEQIEQETVQTAVENLQKATGFKAGWKPGKNKDLDGDLDIQIAGKLMRFHLEIKQELRNHNLKKVIDQAAKWGDFMVVANRILPGVKKELRQNDIAYLEANGNIYINKKPVFIWLDNNKPLEDKREKPNRAFTKTGLQVVFLFLADPTYINKPYRIIAEAADTALGNVNYVINGLLEMGFLVRKNKNELILNNTKVLLDRWITGYEEKLKPALHVGNFRFITANADRNWKDMDINIEHTVWGAEPGGDLLTNHLRPEILTLYTTENQRDFMKHLRVIPDAFGNLKVYRKFWKGIYNKPTKNKGHILNIEKAAPVLLVYADLMNTNNKRCIETAQKIYERSIEPNL